MKLEDEKRSWIKSRLQWDEERRELCQRVAELEKEKEDMDIQECEKLIVYLVTFRSTTLHFEYCHIARARRTCPNRCGLHSST